MPPTCPGGHTRSRYSSANTLLPLLMPLAPASTFLDRVPGHLAALLQAHRIPTSTIDTQVAATTQALLAATANRSVVGSGTGDHPGKVFDVTCH